MKHVEIGGKYNMKFLRDSVLVTGGNGFVGKNLQECRPDWIYLDRHGYYCNNNFVSYGREYDLKIYSDVEAIFKYFKPKSIIHLAAKVGGIKENKNNQLKFYEDNLILNYNVVKAACTLKIPRLLASLTTCSWPDVVEEYPFTEKDIFSGFPAKTNFTYGYSKRMLYVHILAARKEGHDFSCFAPSNIYGPHDHFDDLDKSHFIPAMLTKFYNNEKNNKLEFWGDGKPLRQQLFVKDLVKIIPELLKDWHGDEPLLITPDENLSIEDMIKCTNLKLNLNHEYYFNNELGGQFRKDGSNFLFKSLFPSDISNFTPFEEGITQTYRWYEQRAKSFSTTFVKK